MIAYLTDGCQLLVIGCPEAFSFKKLSDFTPFFDEARAVRNRSYRGADENRTEASKTQ